MSKSSSELASLDFSYSVLERGPRKRAGPLREVQKVRELKPRNRMDLRLSHADRERARLIANHYSGLSMTKVIKVALKATSEMLGIDKHPAPDLSKSAVPPKKRRVHILLREADIETIELVRGVHGLSRSDAVRLLIWAGREKMGVRQRGR